MCDSSLLELQNYHTLENANLKNIKHITVEY
jgi:hypothetical protein